MQLRKAFDMRKTRSATNGSKNQSLVGTDKDDNQNGNGCPDKSHLLNSRRTSPRKPVTMRSTSDDVTPSEIDSLSDLELDEVHHTSKSTIYMASECVSFQKAPILSTKFHGQNRVLPNSVFARKGVGCVAPTKSSRTKQLPLGVGTIGSGTPVTSHQPKPRLDLNSYGTIRSGTPVTSHQPKPRHDVNSYGTIGSVTPVTSHQPKPRHDVNSYGAIGSGTSVATHHPKQRHDVNSQPVVPLSSIDPNLNDATFVVEAPSFIVPYVYEKPAKESFEDFHSSIERLAREMEAKKLDDAKSEPVDYIETIGIVKKPQSDDYFESTLGNFLMDIGLSLVQEHVQNDLLQQQIAKSEKDTSAEVLQSIKLLKKNLEMSKERNKSFEYELIKCRDCSFNTESQLVLENHIEVPHSKYGFYQCNFCSFDTRFAPEILNHTRSDHGVESRFERPLPVHHCPQCPYEDSTRGKLARHRLTCDKRFRCERNQEPPHDWEPPAKIPKPYPYHNALAYTSSPTYVSYPNVSSSPAFNGSTHSTYTQSYRYTHPPSSGGQGTPLNAFNSSSNRGFPHGVKKQGIGVNINRQITGAGSVMTKHQSDQRNGISTSIPQPIGSLSPTPTPTSTPMTTLTIPTPTSTPDPVRQANIAEAEIVVCEICDEQLKGLDELRNHMEWIHKVKIHPKMIYSQPPLNCQKCFLRFFTDEGLDRHLLGSHGLVTDSMQDLANRGQDSGKCPVCGKAFQWKLLSHVTRDHYRSLKPAHLSYKCTVCTATFGQYKLFESHVYSVHSGMSKKSSENNSKPDEANECIPHPMDSIEKSTTEKVNHIDEDCAKENLSKVESEEEKEENEDV